MKTFIWIIITFRQFNIYLDILTEIPKHKVKTQKEILNLMYFVATHALLVHI